MQIIDNKQSRLIDKLAELVTDTSKVYISCDYFTCFALYEINKILGGAESVRVLIKSKLGNEDTIKFIQSDDEAALNLRLDRMRIVQSDITLIQSNIEIRVGDFANQNLIIVVDKEMPYVFTLTPSNLESTTLGVLPSKQLQIINGFQDEGKQFISLFKNGWTNAKQDIKSKIVDIYEDAIRNITPQDIYKYTVRNMFQYATIDERLDEVLEKVGFKNSVIWKLLYNFQKDAVIGAIEKIETYGGCIIADSVGLGKTFEALGVIKYYEMRNSRILVLAPKKLRDNWTIYTQNDKLNILNDDRLRYDVLNHTDLSRDTGKSGDINLETLEWGNYDLIVIDESHNFRNNPSARDRVTRYERLMDDVIKANIKTRVLMLSATPVNNKMNDLKNQIAFITEGNDHAFMGAGIESVSRVMKDAQKRFNTWFRDSDPDNLNIDELMAKLNGGYFRVLDMLTIARSRKHIEKYYDTTEIGEFPTRLTPITYTPPIDTIDKFSSLADTYDELTNLSLAAYTPLSYVRDDKRQEYEEKYDMETHSGSIFKQVDREQSLIYLMRINLLKRLESSVYSFRLTLEKLLKLLKDNLEQLEQHRANPNNESIGINDIDIEDDEFDEMLLGGKTKVLIQDIDQIRWQQDIKWDHDILKDLLNKLKLVDPSVDGKLLKLKEVISNKIDHPINGSNKKVIVFSAFADTTNYLYDHLNEWLLTKKGVYSAIVTGSSTNRSNMPSCKSDLNSILTHFSPISKRRNTVRNTELNEIDILFCTDVISEGQNLQDCDFLINYDIHWNPVRIIQRFGRIDRIGSINDKIQLVNFYPNMELDSFIDLVGRVQGKMVMLDVSATGEDNIIKKDNKSMQDLDYRKRQLKQLQNQVLDIEDVQGNISITDMTFNDFKIDLEKSTDHELGRIDKILPASYSIVKSNLAEIKPGVIFCLKDKDQRLKKKLKDNILYPHFLVYMTLDGEEIVTAKQTKKALDYFRKVCMGNNTVLPELIHTFKQETQQYSVMNTYTKLLDAALQHVGGVKEEIGLDTLATPGGTVVDDINEDARDSFELVSYLIIK